MMHCKTFAAILAVLAGLPAAAQEINTWEKSNGGIISNLNETGNTGDEFLDWSSSVGAFYDEADRSSREVKNRIVSIEKKQKNYVINGKSLTLPSMIDENGIDTYLLTDEGIEIYLALARPVFYQSIDADEAIAKWIRFYGYKNRERTKKMFARFSKWEGYLSQRLMVHGIPPELSCIVLVESACTYNAKSHAGAVGMWQIMPETGRGYGMRITTENDDRLDPFKSTEVACKHLNGSYKSLQDWTLSMAAYNCGTQRMTNVVKKKNSSYWEFVKYSVPKETREYVPSIIALYYLWKYREILRLN